MNDMSSNLIKICVFYYSPVLKQFITLGREIVLIEFAMIDNRGDKVHQQMKSSRSYGYYVEYANVLTGVSFSTVPFKLLSKKKRFQERPSQ